MKPWVRIKNAFIILFELYFILYKFVYVLVFLLYIVSQTCYSDKCRNNM